MVEMDTFFIIYAAFVASLRQQVFTGSKGRGIGIMLFVITVSVIGFGILALVSALCCAPSENDRTRHKTEKVWTVKKQNDELEKTRVSLGVEMSSMPTTTTHQPASSESEVEALAAGGPAAHVKQQPAVMFRVDGTASAAVTTSQAFAAAAPLPEVRAPLPEGWVEHFDANSGKAYYVHDATGKTTWGQPEAVSEDGMKRPALVATQRTAVFNPEVTEEAAESHVVVGEHVEF